MSIYEELKEANGIHFQNLFSQLMKEKYGSQYQPTRTYGNIGDMSVDGVLNFNTAFAVYAPETYNDKKVIEKINSDFNGFLEQREKGNWIKIQKLIFIIKSNRSGITPTVLNLIMEINTKFPVEIWSLDDLKLLSINYLPFSDDGRLLIEFKDDITTIMEYIIDTDFTAEQFRMSLSDDIQIKILQKWNKKKYSFKNEKIEDLKNRILGSLNELCNYLTPLYVHALPNGFLLFNNASQEEGERLREEMQPQVYNIRCKVRDLLNELYDIE